MHEYQTCLTYDLRTFFNVYNYLRPLHHWLVRRVKVGVINCTGSMEGLYGKTCWQREGKRQGQDGKEA